MLISSGHPIGYQAQAIGLRRLVPARQAPSPPYEGVLHVSPSSTRDDVWGAKGGGVACRLIGRRYVAHESIVLVIPCFPNALVSRGM